MDVSMESSASVAHELDDDASNKTHTRPKVEHILLKSLERVSHLDTDNHAMLMQEMLQTFRLVHDFVSKIEQEAYRLENYNSGCQSKSNSELLKAEQDLDEQLMLGCEVMSKIKKLLTLEKATNLEAQELYRPFNFNFEKNLVPVTASQFLFPADNELEATETGQVNNNNVEYVEKTAVEVLAEHLEKTDLEPTYKHINIEGTGHALEHTFSCTVLNLSVEGKGSKKSTAKEEAALQMIKLILKKQKNNHFTKQIAPFSVEEINKMGSLLDTKIFDYVQKLHELCVNSGEEREPIYTVLSETGPTNEPFFSVRCEALNSVGVGHGSKLEVARQLASKTILDSLVRKER
nr:PREDICTED: interferon-inducible double-stranded RNA-dependent protein kinase activator A homolog A-like isoform X5 [Bemisia tabaci]